MAKIGTRSHIDAKIRSGRLDLIGIWIILPVGRQSVIGVDERRSKREKLHHT